MFNNLTKEIIIYSLIPVAVLALINLFVLFLSKSAKKKNYRYNYLIKTGLLLIIGLVLPLILGYTIWIFNHYKLVGNLSNNIGYMILLCALTIALIVLLVIISIKLYKSFNSHEGEIKEEETE